MLYVVVVTYLNDDIIKE